MKLTAKLIGFLNRPFKKDPLPVLGFRIGCDGTGLTWSIADGTLTTAPVGGTGEALSIDLSQYTIDGVAAFLAQQTGYSVSNLAGTSVRSLSALVLLDGAGDVRQSNGDHLFAYTNANWALLDTFASELQPAADQIPNLPLEMSTTTADGSWLDFQGSYYAVPRFSGEADSQYGPRIPATVLSPKGNNIAIAMAITQITGQPVTVDNVVVYGAVEPSFDGTRNFDGSWDFSASAQPVYGLFDVTVGYDLLGGTDPTAFLNRVTGIVETVRDAGTHLRALALSGSALADILTAPSDSVAIPLAPVLSIADTFMAPNDSEGPDIISLTAMEDTLTAPNDNTDSLTQSWNIEFNGQRHFDGGFPFSGGDLLGSIAGPP